MKSVLIKILFVILLAGALFLVLDWRSRTQQAMPEPQIAPENNFVVVAKHTYLNGKHTLEGAIELPTPCHELVTETEVKESSPEQVLIKFTVEAPETDVFCIQVIDQGKFKADFFASEKPVISATLNGRPISMVIESDTLAP